MCSDGPQLVVLLENAVEHLQGDAVLEEVGHWG